MRPSSVSEMVLDSWQSVDAFRLYVIRASVEDRQSIGLSSPQVGGVRGCVVAPGCSGKHSGTEHPSARRCGRHRTNSRGVPTAGRRPRGHGAEGDVLGASVALVVHDREAVSDFLEGLSRLPGGQGEARGAKQARYGSEEPETEPVMELGSVDI